MASGPSKEDKPIDSERGGIGGVLGRSHTATIMAELLKDEKAASMQDPREAILKYAQVQPLSCLLPLVSRKKCRVSPMLVCLRPLWISLPLRLSVSLTHNLTPIVQVAADDPKFFGAAYAKTQPQPIFDTKYNAQEEAELEAAKQKMKYRQMK